MKITFLLPHVRISGGVKAILEYANRLLQSGHQVNVVIPPEKIHWSQLKKFLQSKFKGIQTISPDEIDWFDNKVPIWVLPNNDPGYVPSADILVATAWQTAEFAATLPKDRGEKFYFIQHHESLWSRYKEEAENTYQLPFKKIVISSWLQSIMEESTGQSPEVLVTPVDRQQFYCDNKQWHQPRRVLMLHHDYDWKGYVDGIEAIKKVRAGNRPVDLVVFGEKMADPKPLFDSAGFEFEYHYRPTGDKLRELYSSCDIYLCPSWYEGLGMPAMEAMACRSALVTTDTGGSRDYALHGQTALVSPPKEPGKLAENLAILLEDNSRLQLLSENGFKKIQEFDWDHNTQRMEQLFQSQLNSG